MTDNKAVTTPKKPALQSGGGVNAIVPQDLDQAFRLANAICSAGMAPKAYDRSAEKICVGILHGLEVGLTPMAALQSIAVINGTPSIWGDGALALVRSSGLLEDFEETIDGAGDARTATCRANRKGQKTAITKTFSMAEASTAGLKGKTGPWKQYPDRMLQMRARSYALRDGFADVLKGLRFTEEVRDMNPKDMGTLQDDGSGGYKVPPRPTQADFDQDKQEPVELIQIRDAFGELVGEFSTSDFVENCIDIIEGADNAEMLDSFMEHNADAIESLGTRSDERKEIAEACNAARENFAADEMQEPEPESDEKKWAAWCAEYSKLIADVKDVPSLNALVGFKQSDFAELKEAFPKWHAEILDRVNARNTELNGDAQ